MRIGGINGGVEITGKAALAPMAGVADRAFRRICVEYGAAYVVGEMVSSKGLNFGDRKSAELLELGEEERPAAVQLFGDDPEQMARWPWRCGRMPSTSTWAAPRPKSPATIAAAP